MAVRITDAMNASKGISVGCTGSKVYVRVVGRGTFQNGQPLRGFALEMIDQGYKEFVVDLSQCQGMDSTFLGVLAGIGLRLRQNGNHGKVHILNVSASNMELLQTLGLDRLFSVDACLIDWGKNPPPAETDLRKLPDSDVDALGKPVNKNETSDLMLEAHDNLVRCDERNAPKFKDLTRFLREKIERRNATEKEPD
jgi:anti-sigma B factor antagonist